MARSSLWRIVAFVRNGHVISQIQKELMTNSELAQSDLAPAKRIP
jgi:hypothetical protein